jgi:hypothetical protein
LLADIRSQATLTYNPAKRISGKLTCT